MRPKRAPAPKEKPLIPSPSPIARVFTPKRPATDAPGATSRRAELARAVDAALGAGLARHYDQVASTSDVDVDATLLAEVAAQRGDRVLVPMGMSETDDRPFSGDNFKTNGAKLAVMPAQRPHPPLWMMSRDPATLEFCAREGINTGYFISVPREEAAPRYRKFLEDWTKHGHAKKPNIAYSTDVYVDESDDKACEVALKRASRAYEGLLPLAGPGEGLRL